MAGPKVAPKPAVKVLPKPPAKASPGAKAAALQQAAANQQAAIRAEAVRRNAITKPMGAKFSGSHPTPTPIGKGYQPPKPASSKSGTTILGPRGQSNISDAMKAGAKRKGLINR